MPWIIARLRNQKVYARATGEGELHVQGGRVEIRYRPNDGRLYHAAARNLTVVEPELLPDETCGPAEPPPERPKRGAASASKGGTAGASAAVKSQSRSGAHGSEALRRASAAHGAGEIETAGSADPARLTIFTDGACSSNPGPAGLGVVVVRPEERIEISEYLGRGTNNIAELTAVLRGLEEVGTETAAVIHTDSQYAIGVLQRGWKAKANAELVGQIREELRRRPQVRLQYVPGHQGVPLNERADQLAREAISRRASRRTVVAAAARGA